MLFALVSCQLFVDSNSSCPSDMKYISGGTFVLGSDLGQNGKNHSLRCLWMDFAWMCMNIPIKKGKCPSVIFPFGKLQRKCDEINKDFVHLQNGNALVEEPRVGDIPMEITMIHNL